MKLTAALAAVAACAVLIQSAPAFLAFTQERSMKTASAALPSTTIDALVARGQAPLNTLKELFVDRSVQISQISQVRGDYAAFLKDGTPRHAQLLKEEAEHQRSMAEHLKAPQGLWFTNARSKWLQERRRLNQKLASSSNSILESVRDSRREHFKFLQELEYHDALTPQDVHRASHKIEENLRSDPESSYYYGAVRYDQSGLNSMMKTALEQQRQRLQLGEKAPSPQYSDAKIDWNTKNLDDEQAQLRVLMRKGHELTDEAVDNVRKSVENRRLAAYEKQIELDSKGDRRELKDLRKKLQEQRQSDAWKEANLQRLESESRTSHPPSKGNKGDTRYSWLKTT